MKKKKSNEIDQELKPWLNKINGLHQWINSNTPSHKDWEQKRRELSIALHKVKQIEGRGKRPKSEIANTYSLPSINY